jgi:hypothetical protein
MPNVLGRSHSYLHSCIAERGNSLCSSDTERRGREKTTQLLAKPESPPTRVPSLATSVTIKRNAIANSNLTVSERQSFYKIWTQADSEIFCGRDALKKSAILHALMISWFFSSPSVLFGRVYNDGDFHRSLEYFYVCIRAWLLILLTFLFYQKNFVWTKQFYSAPWHLTILLYSWLLEIG